MKVYVVFKNKGNFGSQTTEMELPDGYTLVPGDTIERPFYGEYIVKTRIFSDPPIYDHNPIVIAEQE